jgi:hypothetical protein
MVPLLRYLIEILKAVVPDVYRMWGLRHLALGSEAPLERLEVTFLWLRELPHSVG